MAVKIGSKYDEGVEELVRVVSLQHPSLVIVDNSEYALCYVCRAPVRSHEGVAVSYEDKRSQIVRHIIHSACHVGICEMGGILFPCN